MKNIFLLLFLGMSAALFAQDAKENSVVQPDARLYEVYAADYLQRLQTKNPFLIQRWNFFLDHGFYVTDMPAGKDMTYSEITVADVDKINILQLEKEQNLTRDFNKRMRYRIAGTDKLLICYSGKEFRDALNIHLGRSHSRK